MYKSPIDIFYGQIETHIEGEIMKAAQKVHVNVDKDELLRALQYDRGQYEKGYDDAIAELEAKSKWIPVTERLPEKITNKVIVLCKNGYRGFGHYEDYKGKQTWYNLESCMPFTSWGLEDCESYEVTHWMPLPEPPNS